MFKEVLLCGAKQKGTNWIYGVPQSGMFFSCICSQITTLCLWAAVGLNQNKSKWMDSMDESKFVQCVLCGKITMVYH